MRRPCDRLALAVAVLLAVHPGAASAGPVFDLPVPLTPTYTTMVSKRFTACCGARTWVQLDRSDDGAALLDWEMRPFARDGASLIGGRRERLVLTPPAECESLRIHAWVGEGAQPFGPRVAAERAVLEPGVRTEVVALERARVWGTDDDLAPPPRADARSWSRGVYGMALGAPSSGNEAPTCDAVLRIAEDADVWQLDVSVGSDITWGRVAVPLPRRTHPVAYPLYPLAIAADVLWTASAVPANIAVFAGLIVASPFVWLAGGLSDR